MEIIEVKSRQTVDLFHKLPEIIYKNDLHQALQLRMMVENTFNPQKNSKFKNGDAKRWIITKNNDLIGRIAAFYDPNYSKSYDQPTGGIGFFECLNDEKAAFLLFDTAKNWLEKCGYEAMDGPINFGENFFFWGLWVSGRKEQAFGMQYNPAYYIDFFRNYGFKTFYQQYSHTLDVTEPDLPGRFWKVAERITKNAAYTFEHFQHKKSEKYIADFIEIHSVAWQKHGNYEEIKPEQLRDLTKNAKLLLESEFIWFVYHNSQPIGFIMMIPDLNQILRKLKSGKLSFWNIVKLLYYKKIRTMKRARVIVLGVVPQYQNKGLESSLFLKIKEQFLQKPWYNEMEMGWVGDFNPKMYKLFDLMEAERTNIHETFRYLFAPSKEFKHQPIID